MIPESDEYLSFLMGADVIADRELAALGIRIQAGAGTAFRQLLIPKDSLPGYVALIREKLTPGFWNDIIGRREIIFIFKLADSSIKEFKLSETNRAEIARLCSSLNNEPIERTSDVARYLSGNSFYRELIETFHGHGSRIDSPAGAARARRLTRRCS